MKRMLLIGFSLVVSVLSAQADLRTFRESDERNVLNGMRIPGERYVDQPYVVVTSNGTWVCVMTTGRGIEGQDGQHVVSSISTDQGKTWSAPVDIEPAEGPEASWATPLITPSGRIYVFYVFNGDQIITLPGSERRIRSDTHGWYVFRYSDDGGKSWSAQRYRVPIRTTNVDRGNPWRGEVCHFWSIDKPKIQNGKVYLALTKLGKYFMRDGEGWIIESENLLTERDPDRIAFRLLPEGEKGIRNPAFGSVQEEFNVVPLQGNRLAVFFRLNSGTAAQSYSEDGGMTWSLPEPMTFGPGKRAMKTPRACPKAFKTSDGKYLFWFHHHGGTGWAGRNPAFLSGGILKEDGKIHWSEPEMVLFDPQPTIRMSYPDLIEQDGQFWITESQKSTARVHPLNPQMLQDLWTQASLSAVTTNGLVFSKLEAGTTPARPSLPSRFGDLSFGGVTVEMWISMQTDAPGQLLFSSEDETGAGFRVSTSQLAGKPTWRIDLGDGHRIVSWHTDPGLFQVKTLQHLVWICDYSAGVILPVLNGVVLDGGTARPQGWGRIPAGMDAPRGASQGYLDPQIQGIRLYQRPLRTSEAIANGRFGLPAVE